MIEAITGVKESKRDSDAVLCQAAFENGFELGFKIRSPDLF